MLGAKKNKEEVDYKKIRSKEFEVNVILDKLNEYLCIHIQNQINAGADVIQIFDSWAGLVPIKNLPNYCYVPNLKIVDYCKVNKIPVICFPRGIKDYKNYISANDSQFFNELENLYINDFVPTTENVLENID